MIGLDYRLNEEEFESIEQVDLTTADETSFLYYLFCGDIFFRINQAVFDAEWGWIPILGFAETLYSILKDLPETQTDEYIFTESDDQIRFELVDSALKIDFKYTTVPLEKSIEVDYEEMKMASLQFLAKVLDDFENQWPELYKNPTFKSYRALVK
ncbi:hypothetical protein [Candidatus Protochlamydia phocaeensis]|uniref:hypothetical protein n=1 Tax=Candidatus Protochlamydia phocaeensis TaxID=1414722 RepID=UPI00083853EF|nr:hypothetical protein [Candidatus Protochlamydia phocaeensis]